MTEAKKKKKLCSGFSTDPTILPDLEVFEDLIFLVKNCNGGGGGGKTQKIILKKQNFSYRSTLFFPVMKPEHNNLFIFLSLISYTFSLYL